MPDIRPSIAGEARARLQAHIEKYKNYLDRDRDILMLHLLDRIDELHKKVVDKTAPVEITPL